MLVVAGTSGVLGGGQCKPDFSGSCDAMKLRAVCRPVEVRSAAAVSGGELRRSGLRRAAGRGRDVLWGRRSWCVSASTNAAHGVSGGARWLLRGPWHGARSVRVWQRWLGAAARSVQTAAMRDLECSWWC